jgi:hypothetical protein
MSKNIKKLKTQNQKKNQKHQKNIEKTSKKHQKHRTNKTTRMTKSFIEMKAAKTHNKGLTKDVLYKTFYDRKKSRTVVS